MTLKGWINDNTGDFFWVRQRGSTGNELTGPSYDHTTYSENGHYIYINVRKILFYLNNFI